MSKLIIASPEPSHFGKSLVFCSNNPDLLHLQLLMYHKRRWIQDRPVLRRVWRKIFLPLASVVSPLANADTTTWTGTSSTRDPLSGTYSYPYANVQNWTNGIPETDDVAIISGGNRAVLNGNREVGILRVGSKTSTPGSLSVSTYYDYASYSPIPAYLTLSGLTIGTEGKGFLQVDNNSTVETADIYSSSIFNQVILAQSVNSEGTIELTRSAILDTRVGKAIILGQSGLGQIKVKTSSEFYSRDAILGSGIGSTGLVLIDGEPRIRNFPDFEPEYGPASWTAGYVGVGTNAGHGFVGIIKGGQMEAEIVEVDAPPSTVVNPVTGNISLIQIEGPGSALHVSATTNIGTSSPGTSAINIGDGGELASPVVNLGHFSQSLSIITLTGTPGRAGILETGGFVKGDGTASINFDGGILKASRSNEEFFKLDTGVKKDFALEVVSRGLVVDTTIYNIRIGSPIKRNFAEETVGPGGLLKFGSGDLTLKGASTYEGPTEVLEGRLFLYGSLLSAVTVRSGSAFAGIGSVRLHPVTIDSGAKLHAGENNYGVLTAPDVTINGDLEVQTTSGDTNRLEALGSIRFGADSRITNTGAVVSGRSHLIATAFGTISGTPAVPEGCTLTIVNSTNPKQLYLSKGPASPDISVQSPYEFDLTDGKAKKGFGTVKIGKSSAAKQFVVLNTGAADLTGLSIVRDGAQAKEFILTKLSKTTLKPGEITAFKVTFKPTAKGTRNAAIHIKSNDTSENPFDIKLTGAGATK